MITLGEGAAALAGGKGAGGAGAIAKGEKAAVKEAASKGVNLNNNAATSTFGIYEIKVNGKVYKYGKADLERVTQSSGLPTRLHQQLRQLIEAHGKENVRGRLVENLGEITTTQAKAAETARIREHFKQTGVIPPGNEKSFKP